MPTMFVRATSTWYPRWQDHGEVSPHSSEAYQFRFTHAVMAAIPDMVAAIIREVDDVNLESGEVVVYPELISDAAINASAFCFDFQPGNGGLTDPNEQRVRRAVISDMLGEKIADFIQGYDWPISLGGLRAHMAPATWDVEVRPAESAGHTYVQSIQGQTFKRPQIKHSWGHPESLAAQ
jgi:hypothetical protein